MVLGSITLLRVDSFSLPSKAEIIVINSLLKELSPHARTIDRNIIRRIVWKGAFFVARDEAQAGKPVGIGTLLYVEKPTGVIAQIEDVVVAATHRGRGIGELITDALIKCAREWKARCIDLTSGPSRVAANALYQKLGFERRETNVYRLKL